MKNATQTNSISELLKRTGIGLMKQSEAKAVINAYSDCCDADGERDLNFICKEGFSLEEARKLLLVAVPGGYNAFEAESAIRNIESAFGNCATVFIAREGSVCLYVKPSRAVWIGGHRGKSISALSADEISYEPNFNLFRIWWD